MANVPPLAPTLTFPPNNSYVVFSDPIAFAWTFQDPGDTQSSASLRYRVPGAGLWTTLTDVAGSAMLYMMPASALTEWDITEWQVSTKDSGGLWSPWSASRFVNTISAPPAPTITAPAHLSTVTSSPMTVTWTLPVGYTQDAWQVFLTDDEFEWTTCWYDSGVVEGVVQSTSVPVVAPFGVNVYVHVLYRYNGYWKDLTHRITNGILPPETPLLVLEQVTDRPEVMVRVTNPVASDAGHLNTWSWDLARDGVPIAKNLSPNTTFTDRFVGAGPVEFKATARTALGGIATSY